MELGIRLKQLRKTRKLSQAELSEILNITPQAISKWETNKSMPDIEMLRTLSELYEISLDDMLQEPETVKSSFEEQVTSNIIGTIIREDEKRYISLNYLCITVLLVAYLLKTNFLKYEHPTAQYFIIFFIYIGALSLFTIVYFFLKTQKKRKLYLISLLISEIFLFLLVVFM